MQCQITQRMKDVNIARKFGSKVERQPTPRVTVRRSWVGRKPRGTLLCCRGKCALKRVARRPPQPARHQIDGFSPGTTQKAKLPAGLALSVSCKYSKGQAVFRSDCITTISVIRDLMSREATSRKCQLSVNLRGEREG